MSNLNGKVIIVTGALGGIGRASARLMAEAGAAVVITDIVDAGGAEFAEELSNLGGGASFVAADLTDEAQVEGLVAHAVDTFGGLHGAFNNAGIVQKVGPLVDYSSEDFQHILRVNTVSIFHCLKHEMRVMPHGGSIVNTASAVVATAVLNAAAYTASKHAVCGLTRSAAVEGGPQNIRVNAILPGAVLTQQQIDAHGAEASQRRAAQVHLLGRAAETVEIGNLARWLISDESSFVTGGLLPVDGGASAGRRV